MAALRIRLVARVGRPRTPVPPFLAGSAVVHVLLVAALLLWPGFRSEPRPVESFMVVDLAASAPSTGVAAARAPVASAPTPSPSREEEEVAVLDPVPQRTDPPRPRPEPRPRPDSPPSPSTSSALTEAGDAPAPGNGDADADTGEGAPAGAGTGTGGSITALGIGDVEFAWYRDSVTAALYANWQRPILSGVREEMEVSVRFEILRDGRIGNPRLERPSGVPMLDRSALRAVHDASPLPPLPSTWPEPTLAAGFVFRLFPDES